MLRADNELYFNQLDVESEVATVCADQLKIITGSC